MSSRSSTLGSLPLGASGSGDSCSSYECLGGWASGGGVGLVVFTVVSVVLLL